MNEDQVKTREVVEQFIRGLVVVGGDPVAIMAGIHNAFIHGEILEGRDDYQDTKKCKYLGKLFDGFDKSSDALLAMKERTRG